MAANDEHREQNPARTERWVQIVMMPLVVALVGSLATFFITKYQGDSAEKMAAVERESAERRARTEFQLKSLEIFFARITSKDAKERELAVKVLSAVDPDLAGKLASAVAKDESENPAVRQEARAVVEQARTRGYSFPVVGSFRSWDNAVNRAKSLISASLPYKAEIYLAENNLYAVTLGGYLTHEEAMKRVDYAKKQNIARDAYIWTSQAWGDNLLK